MSSNETIKKDRTNLYPYSQESLKNWARRRYWHLEEAILLILGEEPNEQTKLSLFKVLNGPRGYYLQVEASGGPKELSPILVDQFKEIYEIARRYGLPELISPRDFLTWAQEKMGYTIQKELLKAVNKFWPKEPEEEEISGNKYSKHPDETKAELNINKLDRRTEKSLKYIIGALLAVIEGRDLFTKHPQFKNRTKFIEALEERYSGYRGISKTNLFTIFSEVEKLIENQNLEDS